MHAIPTPPTSTSTMQTARKDKKTSFLKKVWTPCVSSSSSSYNNNVSARSCARNLSYTNHRCNVSSTFQAVPSPLSLQASEENDVASEDTPEFCDPASKCGETIGDRWILKSLLGTGTYGAVYMAEEKDANEQKREKEKKRWAIKVLWKAGLDADQLLLQRLEVEINARLVEHAARLRLPEAMHPNIVPMRHFYEDGACLYLVMALHTGDDLYDVIQQTGGLSTSLVKHVFRQIVAAVRHSHDAGVFHRDLKPENVLVTPDWQCQLCDYGLSSMETVTAELGCGSAPYMAPEARGGYKSRRVASYSCREADIWSLGIVLLNLVFACNPWKVASDADPSFEAFMQDPSVLQRQFGMSAGFYQLLVRIFALDPRQRPLLDEIDAIVAALPSFSSSSSLSSSTTDETERTKNAQIVLSSSPTDIPSIATFSEARSSSSSSAATSSCFETESESETESDLQKSAKEKRGGIVPSLPVLIQRTPPTAQQRYRYLQQHQLDADHHGNGKESDDDDDEEEEEEEEEKTMKRMHAMMRHFHFASSSSPHHHPTAAASIVNGNRADGRTPSGILAY